MSDKVAILYWVMKRRKKVESDAKTDGDMPLLDIACGFADVGTAVADIASASSTLMPRLPYVPKPNAHYWERVLLSWDNQEYWKNLRLHRETFMLLTNELRTYILKTKTNYKEPISPECRVAICLWRLASGTTYREISRIFGLGKSTVFMVTVEVTAVMNEKLLKKYVSLPESSYSASLDFGIRNQLPNCVGAIDGCHIVIPKPVTNGDDYYNRKGRYSINVQAVVDQKGRFIDVVIGWPGKAHDSRILRNSELFWRGQNGTLFPQSDLILAGKRIPFYIIGDAAYPLKSWLMKPYSSATGEAEIYFNRKLSQARMTVERAFGRLKARWRCLLRCCDACPENARMFIAACITLHNLCELHGDNFEEATTSQEDESQASNSDTQEVNSGDDIRNALRDFLSNYNLNN